MRSLQPPCSCALWNKWFEISLSFIFRWGTHLLYVTFYICPFVRPSVCRAPYPRNRTPSDYNFWYTYAKWSLFLVHWCKMIISPRVFFIFLKFWFFGLLGEWGWGVGSKKAKNGSKLKIITSVMHHISGTV